MTILAPGVPSASPYKGLAAFEDSATDALLFFGRSRETEVVAANVLASRLTVLYGPSGVGKSSLLRAGVVRTLRQSSGFPAPAVAVYGTWAGEPLKGLEEATRAAVTQALGREPADAPGGLSDRFAAWSAELGAELCLLIDQLEELFLYHPAEEGAAGFGDLLPELVLRPGLRVNVLLGIRDDALAQLDVFKSRIPGLFANSLRLDHLDRAAGRAAILGPLERYDAIAGPDERMDIEPELVEVVLDEVAAGRIEPSLAGRGAVEGVEPDGRIETPYLQLVLQRLWEVERERGSRLLRLETFRALGGAERIVQDHLERALRALTPDEQAAAASVFGHLVTPSGTKIAHGVADLATYASVGEQELEPVLDSLARQRILRPLGENGHAGGRYEIFHDVLAGAVLAWRTRHDADAVLAHEREVARRRHRRLAWLAAAALVGLVLMASLAAYAFSQRSKAREQTASANAQRTLADTRSAELKSTNEQLREARDDATSKAQQAAFARRKADLQANRAKAERVRADEKAKEAKDQAALAEAGKTEAKSAQAVALREAQAARLAEDRAQLQEGLAKKQKRNAEEATQDALAAERRARARYLIARSVRLLAADPESSAGFAVRATKFAADKGDRLDAENALRAALVAMRVQHILPGVGSDGARVAHFSADGRRVVVAVGPNARGLRIYRARDGRLLRTFHADTALNDAAMSPDGRFAAAAGADGRVWIWDVDASTVRQLDHDAPVTGVAWSPVGNVLVSVGEGPNPSARIWNPSTGALLYPLPHPLPLAAAVFSPDGQRLATYGEGRFARVFDVSTGILLSTLEHPAGPVPVTSAAFGPQGETIVTSRGRVARLWKADTGEVVRPFGLHTGTISDVAFSPDGGQVATGSIDTVTRVWNTATGGLDNSFWGHTGLGVNDVDFSPDSSAVVSAGADGTARFWSTGQLSVSLLGHHGAVLGASFSRDGQQILTASKDGTARLWDPYGEPVPKPLATYGRGVTSVAVDPTGSLIAVGREDGGVQVLSPDRRVVSTPLSSGPRVVTVAWARGQKLLAATTDGHVQIWADAGTSPLHELDHGSTIRAAAISADGKLVATAGQDKTMRLWQVPSGTFRTLKHPGPVTSVAFDPTGRLVATASGEAAFLWRTSGGTFTKFEPEGDTGVVTGVTFGAGGRLLATSSNDSYARIWSVRTGKLVKTLVRHGTAVVGVAFSPDGRWLVTAAARKAAVWQVGKSDLEGSFLFFVAPPRNPPPTLTTIAFSQNHTIVMGGRNGTVRTYKCLFCGRLGQLVPLANAKLAHLGAEARR